jgi:hypothetical protein
LPVNGYPVEHRHSKFEPMHGCLRLLRRLRGVLITFDKALASRGAYGHLTETESLADRFFVLASLPYISGVPGMKI